MLFSPDHFFKALLCNGGIRDPLAFGLLVGSFGALLGFFWQFLLLSGGLLSMGESFLDRFSLALVFLIVMVILPVYVIVKLFVNSGIVHLLLRILGAEKNGFEATFRVMAYSRAAHIWALIPFIGGWVGGLWQLVIQVIGLRRIHETSYSRVILAFAIPLTFAFLLVIGVSISVFVYLSERGWI